MHFKACSTAMAGLMSVLLVTAASGCKDPPDDPDHGFACVEVYPSISQDDPVALFAGTTEIRVTVNYLECLQDFYLNAHNEYAKDGVEGEAIFAEYAERTLCDPEDVPNHLECSVLDITQDLGNSLNMTIRYAVSDPQAIQGRKILVGPLPLESLAECKPDVKITNASSVSGYDAGGAQIWVIETFSDTQVGRASLKANGCMAVNVKRN
ncbi:MAG: hypothetical protein R3B09_18405 [Nannocystaceae bacterium]